MAEIFCRILQVNRVNFEVIDFNKLNILPYKYQDQINLHSPHYVKDDFIDVLNKIFAAKFLRWFSPVHWCGLARAFRDFQDRYSEAMRRPELNFSKNMAGKTLSYAMVSGSDPIAYKEAFWHIQETIQKFPFIKTNFVRGPWFIARNANELQTNQANEVMIEMQSFAKKLQLIS
jgi:multimeric flavodoxin WrbA